MLFPMSLGLARPLVISFFLAAPSSVNGVRIRTSLRPLSSYARRTATILALQSVTLLSSPLFHIARASTLSLCKFDHFLHLYLLPHPVCLFRTAPNVTSQLGCFLQMTDNSGNVMTSPEFTLSRMFISPIFHPHTSSHRPQQSPSNW